MERRIGDTRPTAARSGFTRPAKPFRAQEVLPSTAPQSHSRARMLWAAIIVTVLLSMPVALLVGAYGWMRLDRTIAPGVQVGEIPLGGMSISEAAMALDQWWNQEFAMTAVDTGDAGRIWTVRPSEFGLSIDAQRTAEAAFAFGREGSLLSSISDVVSSFSTGTQLEPVVRFDSVVAREGLLALSESASIPAVDAQIQLAAGQITTAPARWGIQLDIDSSIELIAMDPEAVLLRYGFVPLVTNTVPPAIEEVASAAGEAERILSRKPILRAYDPVIGDWFEFEPSRAQMSSWLRINQTASGIETELDHDAIERYLRGLQSDLGGDRTLDLDEAMEAMLAALGGEEVPAVHLSYLPRYHVVAPADTLISISFKVGIPYWRWLEDNPEVKARGLRLGESLTIPPRDAMLELPVVEGKRVVVSISEQRMWLEEEGEIILEHIVSTGIPNSPTMPGIFQIKSHYENAYASNWDLYMPHFLGIYNATPNLLNGIHGLPLLSSGVRLWENVLGSPASYGCVILDLEAAEHLFNWAEDGVVVEIRA